MAVSQTLVLPVFTWGPAWTAKGDLAAACCPVPWFYIVEIEPHYIAQIGLELEILLPQVPGSCRA